MNYKGTCSISEEELGVIDAKEERAEAIHAISNILDIDEEPEIKKICSKRVPQVGDYVLVNQREMPLFSRVHGGRYYTNCEERYFGRVVNLHPHIVVMESNGQIKTEIINDFKVGLIEFVRLKAIPNELWKMPYDSRKVHSFAEAFTDLLL